MPFFERFFGKRKPEEEKTPEQIREENFEKVRSGEWSTGDLELDQLDSYKKWLERKEREGMTPVERAAEEFRETHKPLEQEMEEERKAQEERFEAIEQGKVDFRDLTIDERNEYRNWKEQKELDAFRERAKNFNLNQISDESNKLAREKHALTKESDPLGKKRKMIERKIGILDAIRRERL